MAEKTKKPAGMFDDLIAEAEAARPNRFTKYAPEVTTTGSNRFAKYAQQPQGGNFFDQFDEPRKPNFFDQFDEDDRAAAAAQGAQAPGAAESVPERGLIEGIVSDVRNMLGYEQTPQEKAQRAKAHAKFEEDRGGGGWKDTLFSKDGARLVAQGASLGLADEAEAAIRSLGSETYDQALESIRNDLAAARNKPGSLLLEMGAGALVPGGAAVQSLRTAPSIWRAAKYGAGLGGAAGFAGSEGASNPDATMADHLAERLPNAAFSAALGGTAGAVVPAVGAAGRAATGIAAARLGIGSEKFAREALADALRAEARASGRSTDAVLQELEDTGLPLALAGNQSVNQLAHRAAEASPVARRQLIDTIADAEGGAGRRVERAIDDAMAGERAGDVAFAIQDARRLGASRGYDALYGRNAVSDMSAAIDPTRPTMQAAINRANRWIRDENGLEINDVSAMTGKQTDYLVRALDDAVDRAFRSGSGQHGARLAEQRDNFLRSAYQARPEYRDVRAAYAADSDSLRAIEAGRGVKLKDSAGTEEFTAQLADMAPRDRQYARLGVLQNLRDDVRNTATAPNAIRNVAESPARARNLADILSPLADETAPVLGNRQRAALESLPGVIDREARGVRGAQALRQNFPDHTGGLRAALAGVDPSSVATQPKASLTRIAARYALDPMNPKRAALVSQLLRDDWHRSIPQIRRQLAQRGVDVGALTTRWNAALAAAGASGHGYRPAPVQ
ncbi:hypothetical protein [Hyphomicrobium sp.]|uniref:hypothetical protein n=1 Tax=Hyphomicrobium sp. TaxID=82 RepID=UPI0025BED9F2|nr:hypothetical protein [Hyphomicrobium sp.]MCC7251606.1 hypothetical protein [Hyphomicrobium sp.]